MEAPTFRPGETVHFYGDGQRHSAATVRVVRWPEDADLPRYRVPVAEIETDSFSCSRELARVQPYAVYGLIGTVLPGDVMMDTKVDLVPGDVAVYLGTGPRRGQWGVVGGTNGPDHIDFGFADGPIRLVSVWDLRPRDYSK